MKKEYCKTMKKAVACFLTAAMLVGNLGSSTPGETLDAVQIFSDGEEIQEVQDVTDETVPEENVEDVSDAQNPEENLSSEENQDQEEVQDPTEDQQQDESFFTDGEELDGTDLAEDGVNEVTESLQQQLDRMQEAGAKVVSLSVPEELQGSVIQENLTVPEGMDVLLDLKGSTLSPDMTAAVNGAELNNIRVFGTLTIMNGTLSGDMSDGTQPENVRGVQVYYGGKLIVNGGTTITGYHTNGCGGGIYVNYGGKCILGQQESCVISGNSSEENGGGIWCEQADGLTMYPGTVIKDNQAGQNGGGVAIWNLKRGSYTLGNGVTISGNQAQGDGGGFYVNCNKITYEAEDMGLVLDGVQITGNTSEGNGGGLSFISNVRLTIRSGSVTQNHAGNCGGGINAANGNFVTFTGGSVSQNTSVMRGGGICTNKLTYTMTGGQISDNHSKDCGGGLAISTGIVTISGTSSITGNYTGQNGGGIWKQSGSVTIAENATVSENVSEAGGAGIQTADIEITGGRICDNTYKGQSQGGGGVYIYGLGTMSAGVISGNESGYMGGGIYGKINITGGEICNNQAVYGGALAGRGNISGGIFYENTAQKNGGAFYLDFKDEKKDNPLTISGTAEVYDNQALLGGGIYVNQGICVLEGGSVYKNQAFKAGGGIGMSADNCVSEFTIKAPACVYDNQTGTPEGGNDLHFDSTKSSGKLGISLVAASDLQTKEGKTGEAWQEEHEEKESGITDAIHQDTGISLQEWSYTFRYEQKQKLMAASLETDEGQQQYTSIQAAVDDAQFLNQQALAEGQQQKEYRITVLRNRRESVIIPEGLKVQVDLNGWTIRGDDNSVFTVNRGADMTLADSSEDQSGILKEGKNLSHQFWGGGVTVHGTLTMTGGTITQCGGGVYVDGSDAGFMMKNGTICDNTGYGAYISYGSFVMEEGLIARHTIMGGGIYGTEMTITISGGSIRENTADNGGGICCARGGTLTITGGEIVENYGKTNGGGIYLDGVKTTITGGRIQNNEALEKGGGIWMRGTYLKWIGTLFVTGGIITDNMTESGKSDLYIQNVSQVNVIPVRQMDPEAYGNWCWKQLDTGKVWEQIESYDESFVWDLYAGEKPNDEDEVAVYFTDPENEEQKFATIQAAVDAASSLTTEDFQPVLYLLRDSEETVLIQKDQKIILDLNGYTLTAENNRALDVTGELTLKDTRTNPYTNPEGLTDPDHTGSIQPGADNQKGRGVLVKAGAMFTMEGGCITGFHGMTYGGGIYGLSGCYIHIKGGSITGNSAGYGGGVAVYRRTGEEMMTGDITISGGSICKNSAAQDGGGLYLIMPSATNTATVTLNGEISENQTGSVGGGVYIGNFRYLQIKNGIFRKNQAKGNGGGLYAEILSDIHIQGCQAMDNKAENGGGMYLRSGGKALIEPGQEACVFSGNQAVTGGGMYLFGQIDDSRKGTWTIADGVQFINNRATNSQVNKGGGLYVCGTGNGVTLGGVYEKNTCDGIWTEYDGGNFTIDGARIADNTGTGIAARVQNGTMTITGTQVSGNSNGGINLINANGATDPEVCITGNSVIDGNTRTQNGGGICAGSMYILNVDSTKILNNLAGEFGGGLYLESRENTLTNCLIQNNYAEYTGGGIFAKGPNYDSTKGKRYINLLLGQDCVITENTAQGMGSVKGEKGGLGGGIYLLQYTKVRMEGGEILENSSVYGGGLGMKSNCSFIQSAGRIYGNKAVSGKDVCVLGKQDNVLHLSAADQVFSQEESLRGLCWYDETRYKEITDAIKYEPAIQDYLLTFRYCTRKYVAEVADENGVYQAFETIQEAVAVVQEKIQFGVYQTVPQVILIDQIKESATIPGDVQMELNLNGHSLEGFDTAITCQGKLTIKDEKVTSHNPGEGTGSITGNALWGGGIRVLSGGLVTMESGEIKDCKASAPVTAGAGSTDGGGGGVSVEGGTFVLAGGCIRNCQAYRGSAVYIRPGNSVFEMTGGLIQDNIVGYDGTVYCDQSTMRMSGGSISGNSPLLNKEQNCGGAVYFHGVSTGIFTGGEISGNQAKSGGALYLEKTANAQLENIKLENNQATAEGGAISSSGMLNICDGTLIRGNRAEVQGGGIYQDQGVIKMTGGTITENRASYGGGIYQHPTTTEYFTLFGGKLCDNHGTLERTGNDLYSYYDGTYAGNSGRPSATLIRAADMGTDYNVWKNDGYKGSDTTGSEDSGKDTGTVGKDVNSGLYISGEIVKSENLKLTASTLEWVTPENPVSTLQVKSMEIMKTDNCGRSMDGMTDGEITWNQDIDVKNEEVTAEQLLETAGSGATEADENDAAHQYVYNGQTYKMICYNGVWYERTQAVQWGAGDDYNSTNGIIRSFDKLLYELRIYMEDTRDPGDVTLGQDQTTAAAKDDSEKSRLYMEVRLPAGSDEAEFAELSMDEYYVYETQENGQSVQYLRGYYILDNFRAGESGTAEKKIAVKVKGMKNGSLLKPEFRSWIQYNKDNEANPAICSSRTVTVSAAPRYNAVLLRNSELSHTGYFDLETGKESSQAEVEKLQAAGKDTSHIVYGTMMGYGITLQTRNDAKSKGMKGIALPEGEIQLDVSLGGELLLDGISLGQNLAPYAWAYKENEDGETGRSFGKIGKTFQMDWNDEDDKNRTTSYGWNSAPYNSQHSGDSGCNSGGVWAGTVKDRQADGNRRLTLHFTVNNYALAEKGPSKTSDQADNKKIYDADHQQNSFSAVYFQVIYPLDQAKIKDKSGYLEINMDNMISDLQIHSSLPGQQPETTEFGMEAMRKYFGDDTYRDHAVNEMTYEDNYVKKSTGLYLYRGDGNSDDLNKTNYFLKSDGTVICRTEGTGSAPAGSQVYTASDVGFASQEYRTDDQEHDSLHYIPDSEFDPQKDNKVEYNYLTALDVLQKFDADAYTPVGAQAVVDAQVSGKTVTTGTYVMNDANQIDAFRISTTEDATSWSDTQTMKYRLTVLYGAKPDGSNWCKTEDHPGGEADMEQYTAENLIYFTSMADLNEYFHGNGKCVAILFQLRDMCIRTGRQVTVAAKMNVTSEFENIGKTWCLTNEVKGWSTYRPVYKKYFQDGKLDQILTTTGWETMNYQGAEDNLAKGCGATSGEAAEYPAGYEDSKKLATQDKDLLFSRQLSVTRNNGIYRKTEYEDGMKKNGTHTGGWIRGNTLLLYTLDSSIDIQNTDTINMSSNKRRTYYNVTEGERTANYEVTPKVDIASGVKNYDLVVNGGQDIQVEIRITIPKDLHFDRGSLQYKYENGKPELNWTEEIETDENGNTILKLKTLISDVKKKLPKIEYSCTIGKKGGTGSEDVINGEHLTTKAEIRASYKDASTVASPVSESRNTIIALKTKDDVIYKDAEKQLVEIGEDIVYDLNYRNFKESPDEIQFCDMFPVNGDGRGSSFTGGYRLTGIRLDFTCEADLIAFLAQSQQLKITAQAYSDYSTTTGKAQILKDAAQGNGDWTSIAGWSQSRDAVSDGSTIWYRLTIKPTNGEYVVNGSSGSNIRGLYGYVSHITTKERLRVILTFSPEDQSGTQLLNDQKKMVQTGGSAYVNDFFYSSGGPESGALPVSSQKVATRAVSRKISGIAWLDQNQDGYYRAGSGRDWLLSGVDVYLYQEEVPSSGKIAQELDGSFSQTINGQLRNMETTVIDGKTLYPAVDIMGNLLDKVITGRGGSYSFNNLASGTYYVVFRDDNGDYQVVNGSRRLSFGQLSITPVRMDAGQLLSRPGRTTDKALPEYEVFSSGSGSLASMKQAVVKNTGKGITLPQISDMLNWEYVSGNWNCGLYYLELTLVKSWVGVTSVPDQAQIQFKVQGMAEDGTAASCPEMTFTLKQDGQKVAVQADPILEGVNLTPVVSTGQDGDRSMVVWKLVDYPIQAEDACGRITYSCKEESQAEGFILSHTEERTDPQTCKITFTAWNSRIYRLPQMGGSGIWVFQITGAGLMIATLYMYRRRKTTESR